MKALFLITAAAGVALAPLAYSSASAAGPNEYWHLRSECDKHLSRAHNAREFYHRLDECNRHLAEFRVHQRREAIERWKHAEREWRERHRRSAEYHYRPWPY